VNDDFALIDEALQGRPAAFGRLVEKYQDRLYNTLVHLTGQAEDARDVAQDAFAQAFLRLETFQRASSFFTCLYRIAFNLAATRRRRMRPSVSMEQLREATGQEPVDRSARPGDRIEQEERCRQVREAIAQLEEEYRVVLVLREIDGCCYERIAEILDLPVGTVRSRLHRARLQLREQLKQVFAVED
jgi:RNA polymerase sigma-70 factor, ECF subfamily